MIKQIFNVENYWQVIIYYDLDYSLFKDIVLEMRSMGATSDSIYEVYDMLARDKAKAATYSNLEKHISLVLFNVHGSKADYIDSIVHEAEHVKQAMLKAYQVEDDGEPPAYTIGYLISQMYLVFQHLICDCEDS